MSEPVDAQSTRLVYGLDDTVPLIPALLVSIQQVGAMVVGTITPALILSGILHFSPQVTAYLVSMALVASALGTFLQTMRFGFIGSGLLSITGTSFAFLAPLIQAGTTGGLPLMVGMSLAGTPVQLVLSPVFAQTETRVYPTGFRDCGVADWPFADSDGDAEYCPTTR